MMLTPSAPKQQQDEHHQDAPFTPPTSPVKAEDGRTPTPPVRSGGTTRGAWTPLVFQVDFPRQGGQARQREQQAPAKGAKTDEHNFIPLELFAPAAVVALIALVIVTTSGWWALSAWAATAGAAALYCRSANVQLADSRASNAKLRTEAAAAQAEAAEAQAEATALHCRCEALAQQRRRRESEFAAQQLSTDTFGVVLLRSADELTAELREQLRFAAESEIIAGDLVEDSLLFHGAELEGLGPDGQPDWNRVGIDLALVFTMNGVVYGYRTLEFARECGFPVGAGGLPLVLRVNQDVVKPSFQGSALITMMNLRTSAVIREHLPHCRYVILEPTTTNYQGLYRRKGFAWAMSEERGVQYLSAAADGAFISDSAGEGVAHRRRAGSYGLAGVSDEVVLEYCPTRRRRGEQQQRSAWDEYRKFYCEGLEDYETLIFEVVEAARSCGGAVVND